MNDLQFAKFFDYSLHLAKDLAMYRSNHVSKYQIIWKIDNHFATANTLKYQGNSPVKLFVDGDWTPSEQIVNIQNDENRFPANIYQKFYEKFYKRRHFNAFDSLYENNEALFNELYKFVTDLNSEDSTDIGGNIYNVDFLESSLSLPFMKLDDHSTIQPVCLIEDSKN